ncbi:MULTISPECIES: tetratricopeptide repeat protein [unclassified Janthinobacterium]|uniref:tetratricopeptide repeat protein n=1 Tax=unclassified Janthinobacterium TaxID=2610881 RepID=UPI00088C90DC|nr:MULTISPECIES: SEL1-like repeat protein [unclassified Janthinobacterium]SDA74614.1 Sel1 repeat-containing protein [Janthinobacterium sp. 551a]SFB58463.1 Sel1 repeat-containing protein [Janthinobacterium sp. 344]
MMLAAWLLAAALATPGAASPAPDLTARAKVLMRAGPASQPQARALFEQAAEQGSGPAAYYLGLMLKNGMGGQQDGVAALRWLELAAQRGVAPAMFIVANMLLDTDDARARFWLDAACDLEYPEALQQKSVALAEGRMGYAHNEAQANLYLKMATHAMGHRAGEP